MSTITSSFMNIVLVLLAGLAIAQFFTYFKFKHSGGGVSDIDKALWHVRLFTIFVLALVFVAMLYLPTTGFYREIDLSASAREQAFQNVVHNQQRIGEQLDQLREVLYIVFLMVMFYLIVISIFIARIWGERQKLISANDPALRKPIGLDAD